MNLLQALLFRAQHLADAEVLRGMGYTTADEAAPGHLQSITASPYLGLDRDYRDERFGERDFLEALCRCVGLEPVEYLGAIDAIDRRLAEDRAAYRHWLFADTAYVRPTNPTTPIFAMAFTEHLRRLKFPIDFCRLPWEERLAAACQRASDNMQDSGGRLVTWGEIKRYHYCYAEGRSVAIYPQGEVIDERSAFEPPKATCCFAGSGQILGDLFYDREG